MKDILLEYLKFEREYPLVNLESDEWKVDTFLRERGSESKIEQCYSLFKQYCRQENLYMAVIQFFDDESGDIIDDDTKEYLVSFNSLDECIGKLKEKIK